MSIFAQARAGLPLSPGQRALLKLVEGWVIAGVLSALAVLYTALGNPHPNWGVVATACGFAFATGALIAAAKYFKAQGDAPLAAVLTQVAADVPGVLKAPTPTPAVAPSDAPAPSA